MAVHGQGEAAFPYKCVPCNYGCYTLEDFAYHRSREHWAARRALSSAYPQDLVAHRVDAGGATILLLKSWLRDLGAHSGVSQLKKILLVDVLKGAIVRKHKLTNPTLPEKVRSFYKHAISKDLGAPFSQRMRSRITYQVVQHIYLPVDFMGFFSKKDQYSCPHGDIPAKKGQCGTLNGNNADSGPGAANRPPGGINAPGAPAVIGGIGGVRPVSPPPPPRRPQQQQRPSTGSGGVADGDRLAFLERARISAEHYTKILGLNSPELGTDSFRDAVRLLRDREAFTQENVRRVRDEVATMDEIVRVTVAIRKEDNPNYVVPPELAALQSPKQSPAPLPQNTGGSSAADNSSAPKPPAPASARQNLVPEQQRAPPGGVSDRGPQPCAQSSVPKGKSPKKRARRKRRIVIGEDDSDSDAWKPEAALKIDDSEDDLPQMVFKSSKKRQAPSSPMIMVDDSDSDDLPLAMGAFERSDNEKVASSSSSSSTASRMKLFHAKPREMDEVLASSKRKPLRGKKRTFLLLSDDSDEGPEASRSSGKNDDRGDGVKDMSDDESLAQPGGAAVLQSSSSSSSSSSSKTAVRSVLKSRAESARAVEFFAKLAKDVDDTAPVPKRRKLGGRCPSGSGSGSGGLQERRENQRSSAASASVLQKPSKRELEGFAPKFQKVCQGLALRNPPKSLKAAGCGITSVSVSTRAPELNAIRKDADMPPAAAAAARSVPPCSPPLQAGAAAAKAVKPPKADVPSPPNAAAAARASSPAVAAADALAKQEEEQLRRAMMLSLQEHQRSQAEQQRRLFAQFEEQKLMRHVSLNNSSSSSSSSSMKVEVVCIDDDDTLDEEKKEEAAELVSANAKEEASSAASSAAKAKAAVATEVVQSIVADVEAKGKAAEVPPPDAKREEESEEESSESESESEIELESDDESESEPEPEAESEPEPEIEANDKEEEEPDHFCCPITQELMRDPVMANDGILYERSSIASWFAEGHNTSPHTNLELKNQELIPSHGMRSLIMEWQANLEKRRSATRKEAAENHEEWKKRHVERKKRHDEWKKRQERRKKRRRRRAEEKKRSERRRAKKLEKRKKGGKRGKRKKNPELARATTEPVRQSVSSSSSSAKNPRDATQEMFSRYDQLFSRYASAAIVRSQSALSHSSTHLQSHWNPRSGDASAQPSSSSSSSSALSESSAPSSARSSSRCSAPPSFKSSVPVPASRPLSPRSRSGYTSCNLLRPGPTGVVRSCRCVSCLEKRRVAKLRQGARPTWR